LALVGGHHMADDFGTPDYSLRYEKETRSDTLVFLCRGGFSLANHALLDRIVDEIKNAGEHKIVLDLGAIRYLDSVGMGTIASILKHTMAHKVEFALVANPIVSKLLSTSGLDRVIRVTQSLEQALGKAAS
jgi:anti-anti-sigma factor